MIIAFRETCTDNRQYIKIYFSGNIDDYTGEQLKGSLVENPNLGIYQLVYGMIVIAMLVFGIFKVIISFHYSD